MPTWLLKQAPIVMDKVFGSSSWHPNSWENYPFTHIPQYENMQRLYSCLRKISNVEPLIDVNSINLLSQKLAKVWNREYFILQAGDCAEKISDHDEATVVKKVGFLRELSDIIQDVYSPLLIGRIGGQYAKPRSDPYEVRSGNSLPSYFGDLVNLSEYDSSARRPDPQRLLLAYQAAKTILNHINKLNKESEIGSCLFTSHEALHLYYEGTLTRCFKKRWYNLSTHYPWLGMRTALHSLAHVEYFKGISNPIAIKIGPAMTVSRLIWLINTLNPENLPGKVALIHRLGCALINKILPTWIYYINKNKKNVIWMCDPMHGNTELSYSGIKTRYINKIQQEITSAFDIHNRYDSFLHGIHLEVTPYDVTECIDNELIFEKDLFSNYRSSVDPRLNPVQARQIMRLIKNKLLEVKA